MATKKSQTVLDVIIIGGGLSGLVVARQLQHHHHSIKNIQWKLLEARSTLGGRLKNDDSGDNIDLGGAWIWPHVQPKMRDLVEELSIPTFAQPDDDSDGSQRLVGGAVQLIHQLADSLPPGNLLVNSPVKSCTLVSPDDSNNNNNNSKELPIVQVCTATSDNNSSQIYLARQVVLALPPKMIVQHIQLNPPLSRRKQQAMSSCPTWMAAVTKVSLVYPTRFWDRQDSNCGLPGTPAFQMYDASTPDGKISALTFFTLVSASRLPNDQVLADQVADQLSQLWTKHGRDTLAQQVKSYTKYHVQRWPLDPYICDDPNPPQTIAHPKPDPLLSQPEWGGALLFAGSETDQSFPGVMEGAVGAAFRVVDQLKQWQ